MNNKKINIAICGYGNVGRGVENALKYNSDINLSCIVTRRNATDITNLTKAPVINFIDFFNEIEKWKNEIDVMILCGGSATDLPKQGPIFAKYFNTVDSFDTHTNIPEYLKNMNEISKENGNLSVISVGWDPGLFSINRAYANAILPEGKSYTFWGKGVSQGHSDAIRRIKGVKKAIEYTIPIDDSINQVREGKNPVLNAGEKHIRECFVVLEENVNKEEIENQIVNMPNYFSDYTTTVNFISSDEFKLNHTKMPHGGFVIHNGKTSEENNECIEYNLKLDSNPEFTGSILIAYARAIYRLRKSGLTAAITVLDIPPIMLINKDRDDIIKEML